MDLKPSPVPRPAPAPLPEAAELTPFELRDGRWYKREDRYRLPCGVNGAKLRACRHLIARAAAAGYTRVVSASSVLSPQAAMAAVWARHFKLGCTVVLGGTRASSAVKHPSVRLAVEHGAHLELIGVGYNPALQRAGRALAAAGRGWLLPYGITTPPDASPAEVEAFLRVGAGQVANLPPDVRTLVVPFGSGNTAAGVLYGLSLALQAGSLALPDIVLVGIGPDRRAWLAERLAVVGAEVPPYEHIDLHGVYRYGDRVPYTVDGIALHPTYEGKVAAALEAQRPAWWTRRDSTTALWIVGGPLPR